MSTFAYLWERAQCHLLHRLPVGKAWFREVQGARWIEAENRGLRAQLAELKRDE